MTESAKLDGLPLGLPKASPAISRYEPSMQEPLFILAMDHRASFAHTLFGVAGKPTASDLRRMRDAKMVIYEGAPSGLRGHPDRADRCPCR